MASSVFVIAAHDVCDSCNGHSGPLFSLHPLRGPSSAHRTNEALKGAELQSRLDDIRDTQLDIDKFDIEIARLKGNLKRLEHRRAELVDFKNQELSLFSPIRSLPDDVLKHIFMMCQEIEDNPGYIDFVIGQNTFVQRVTRVSNYWRNTALSMPTLWSRVSFAYTSEYMLVSPGEFLERCLTLSGSAPFSIEFGENCDLENLFGERGLIKLAEAAHRWEYITIDAHYGVELGDRWSRIMKQKFLDFDSLMKHVPKDTIYSYLKVLGPIKTSRPITFHSTPALQCVRLTGRDATTSISFPSAPLLTGVETFGYCGNVYDVLPDFPWDQITHFESQASFVRNQLPTLLNKMSSLYYLKVNLNDTLVLPASTDIMLPRLHKLLFSLQKAPLREDLVLIEPLMSFTAPALKELKVAGDCNSEAIIGFIMRSKCNLGRLTLPGDTLPGQWDIDELKTLKYLNVKWSGFSLQNDFPGVMDCLTLKTSGDSHQNVFPQLEVLEFYFPGMFVMELVFPIEGFKDMITSRLPTETEIGTRKKNAGLKSVKLIFEFTQNMVTTELINDYFGELRELGIQAVIRYVEKDDIYSDDSDSDSDLDESDESEST